MVKNNKKSFKFIFIVILHASYFLASHRIAYIQSAIGIQLNLHCAHGTQTTQKHDWCIGVPNQLIYRTSHIHGECNFINLITTRRVNCAATVCGIMHLHVFTAQQTMFSVHRTKARVINVLTHICIFGIHIC